jgi:hypothetical protein
VAKRYGYKDLLLSKLSIPLADEDFDIIFEIGKKMLKINEVNEIAYKALTLSTDVNTCKGKIALYRRICTFSDPLEKCNAKIVERWGKICFV